MRTTAMIATLAGMGLFPIQELTDKFTRPEKKCLNCGVIHEHNNSFCSAVCCKFYKSYQPPICCGKPMFLDEADVDDYHTEKWWECEHCEHTQDVIYPTPHRGDSK